MPDLLIELFSEEIPARMQRRAADDLRKLVTDGVVEAGLTYAGAVAHCTPRRLTLALSGLTEASPTTTEDRKGPRVDAPAKALDGFLRGAGLTRDQLTTIDDKKGQIYVARITREGRPAAAIVAEVLERTIRNFPWPKSMRWGDGTLRWVRPLRSILCILTREEGAEIVPLDVNGLTAGNTTEGHRFMAPGRFAVTSFDDYEAKLKRAKVVLSSEERADAIWQDATNQAFATGLEVVEDRGLLEEVAGLVEWPVVLMGRIDDAFLDLPPEVLRTSMKEHQKFFSVRDKTGRIVRFVTVANRETADDGATILAGNNRVLSARLSDAKFFWENDLRVATSPEGMKAWTDALSNVTFHAKLGSQSERIDRIAALARELAPAVGAKPDLAERAARLAKADLSSEMVYEFPELQGLMGRYYAEAAGEDPAVALAAQEHYSPLGPSDAVPTAPVSVAVALADKLDTLAGFWAIDEKPTGSKDPYALRRAALGVIRLILENRTRLPLSNVFQTIRMPNLNIAQLNFWATDVMSHEEEIRDRLFEAYTNEKMDELLWDLREEQTEYEERMMQQEVAPDPRALKLLAVDHADRLDLLSFFHDRLKQHLRTEDIRHDVIDACLTGDRTDDLANVTARARALDAFLSTDNGENLIQGYKRAKNILDQAEAKDGVEYSYGADPKLADTDEERALFAALAPARPAIEAALAAEDYPAAMDALAALRHPIDAFFEAVQVNSDSEITRRNRLNLLSEIVRLCTKIADLGRIGS